ncbi:MAG: hypothetical protein KDN18_17365 [Verrucomicrobiae bacterium]|nr:hypothetical protein [Verrucomicrobiae bacterium]
MIAPCEETELDLNESRSRETKLPAMMRVVLAWFMVVLIGDPVCCCVIHAKAAPPAVEKSDLPPCCRERLGDATGSVPEKEKDPASPACPCARKCGAVVSEKLALPLPTPRSWTGEIPEPSACPELFARSPDLLLLSLPPPEDPVSNFPPFRVCYGVFRC